MANTGRRNASRKAQLKKALWVNVMSLLLCMIMLVGTTFAWFTSTVTTGVNTVQAGRMQVEMTYAYDADKVQGVLTSEDADQTAGKADTWKEVKTDTNLFKTIGEDNTGKWQPGAAKFVQLKIRNTGDLAMKYSLGISIPEETGSVNADGKAFKLSDYLKVAALDGAVSFETAEEAIKMVEPDADTTTESTGNSTAQLIHEAVTLSDGCVVTGSLLPASETENEDASESQTAQAQEEAEKVLTFLVYMPKTATEANFADSTDTPSIKLGVTLLATQTAKESDTNSADYDNEASYQVNTAQQLQNALLSDNNPFISLNNDIAIESLTIDRDTVLDLNGHTLTLKPESINTTDTDQVTSDGTEPAASNDSLSVFNLTDQDSYLLLKQNVKLTITGEGNITAADDKEYSFALKNGAALTLDAVDTDKPAVTLTGGTKTDTGTGVLTTWKCLPADWKAEEKIISFNDDIKGTLYKMTKDKAASES